MLLNRHFCKIVKNETYARDNIWLLFNSKMAKCVELGLFPVVFSIKGDKFGSNLLNNSEIYIYYIFFIFFSFI